MSGHGGRRRGRRVAVHPDEGPGALGLNDDVALGRRELDAANRGCLRLGGRELDASRLGAAYPSRVRHGNSTCADAVPAYSQVQGQSDKLVGATGSSKAHRPWAVPSQSSRLSSWGDSPTTLGTVRIAEAMRPPRPSGCRRLGLTRHRATPVLRPVSLAGSASASLGGNAAAAGQSGAAGASLTSRGAVAGQAGAVGGAVGGTAAAAGSSAGGAAGASACPDPAADSTGSFDFRISPLPEDGSYEELIAEGEWACAIRAPELKNALMVLHLDCEDAGVVVEQELARIAVGVSPNPTWSEFPAGLAVTYSWRVTTHPWGYYWWGRLTRSDGVILLNGYVTGSAFEPERLLPIEAKLVAGICPLKGVGCGQHHREAVDLSYSGGEPIRLFNYSAARVGEYLLYTGRV